MPYRTANPFILAYQLPVRQISGRFSEWNSLGVVFSRKGMKPYLPVTRATNLFHQVWRGSKFRDPTPSLWGLRPRLKFGAGFRPRRNARPRVSQGLGPAVWSDAQLAASNGASAIAPSNSANGKIIHGFGVMTS